VKKVEMKGVAEKEAGQGSTALNYNHDFRH
jgi:hypothetical protein